jgi:hypothetical protein
MRSHIAAQVLGLIFFKIIDIQNEKMNETWDFVATQ